MNKQIMLRERKNFKKTTKEENKKIIDYVKINPQTNLSKVRKELKLYVWSKTISRILFEEGVKHYIPVYKIYLSEENKRERKKFVE